MRLGPFSPKKIECGAAIAWGDLIAFGNKVQQFAFDLPQIGEPLTDISKLACGQFSGLRAREPALDLQEASNLLECEAHRLRPPDELESRYLSLPVPAHPARWPHRLSQQASALVVADGFHVHICAGREAADGERVGGQNLTPYLGTETSMGL